MNKPINLFEYEFLAPQHLSQMALDYYASGAWDEITLRDNRAAYERYKLRPRILLDVSHRSLTTKILGQQIKMPILIAPMAVQCLAHPQGELVTAKVAADFGIIMVLSTFSTKKLEDVASAANLPKNLWFQLYVHLDRSLTRTLVERAEVAGYQALCLTVDTPVLGRRERDQRNLFTLPLGMELANFTSMANWEIPEMENAPGLSADFANRLSPTITWKDIDWLQSLTSLPIVVKGILRADDGIRAVEHGAKGIIVSNHGGRQLDGAIATIDALSEIVAAVGSQVDVMLDGGIRRGTDILKALALGAKAVLIGRPILWALAVDGAAGIHHLLELLHDELDVAMALSGCTRVQDIDASLVRHI